MGTSAWLLASMVIIAAASLYETVGVLFALVFLVRGVMVVDHAAANSGWKFRLLILPGVAMLWPLMVGKWLRAVRHAGEHRP